ITANELGIVMQSLGLNPPELKLQGPMNEVDTDRSGCIEFSRVLVSPYSMTRPSHGH
ncbi:hypothetical protein ASPSYDRAFT_147704, partial [Aspergillus sydowii CBS 593.65]